MRSRAVPPQDLPPRAVLPQRTVVDFAPGARVRSSSSAHRTGWRRPRRTQKTVTRIKVAGGHLVLGTRNKRNKALDFLYSSTVARRNRSPKRCQRQYPMRTAYRTAPVTQDAGYTGDQPARAAHRTTHGTRTRTHARTRRSGRTDGRTTQIHTAPDHPHMAHAQQTTQSTCIMVRRSFMIDAHAPTTLHWLNALQAQHE